MPRSTCLFGSAGSLPAAYPEARYAQIEQCNSAKQTAGQAHAAPCWSRFSLNGASCPDSGAHHPWFARRDTSKMLVDQRCCFRIFSTTLLKRFAVGARAACPQRTPKYAMRRSSNVIMLSKSRTGARGTLLVSLFPQRGILPRFGRSPSLVRSSRHQQGAR